MSKIVHSNTVHSNIGTHDHVKQRRGLELGSINLFNDNYFHPILSAVRYNSGRSVCLSIE